MTNQRMAILADNEFNEAQTAITRSYRLNGEVVNVVRLFARFMDSFKVFKPFALYCQVKAKLDPRVRELAILKIAILNQCDYEWGHHARIAHDVGLSWEDIGRVRRGGEEGWNEADALVLRATEAIRRDAQIDDEVYDALIAMLGEEHLLEFLMVIGNYNMVSTILNVTGVPLEPGTMRLTDPLPSE